MCHIPPCRLCLSCPPFQNSDSLMNIMIMPSSQTPISLPLVPSLLLVPSSPLPSPFSLLPSPFCLLPSDRPREAARPDALFIVMVFYLFSLLCLPSLVDNLGVVLPSSAPTSLPRGLARFAEDRGPDRPRRKPTAQLSVAPKRVSENG